MKLQALLWKPHNMTFVCCNLFAIINSLLVDIVNLQMLQRIICKSQQTYGNMLNHISLVKKIASNTLKPMGLFL
jgi:hypothetical protein